MAKAVAYSIKGTSKVKPTDLPEGLRVETTVVDVPTDVTVQSRYGMKFRFRKYTGSLSEEGEVLINLLDPAPFGGAPRINTDKIMDRENVRKLRDALTELLDETLPLRKVVDGQEDAWYEIEPNKFRMGFDRAEATRKHLSGPLHASSLERITDTYGVNRITFE